MNNNQLQRTLRLLRRTGDRGIIMDQESDEVFVLMDADSYEKMLPEVATAPKLSADEGLEDYVLDDILEIEERRHVDVEPQPPTIPSRFTAPKEQNEVKTEKTALKQLKTQNLAENWAKETVSPIISEENLSDVPHDGEEEEKFYLEPVE